MLSEKSLVSYAKEFDPKDPRHDPDDETSKNIRGFTDLSGASVRLVGPSDELDCVDWTVEILEVCTGDRGVFQLSTLDPSKKPKKAEKGVDKRREVISSEVLHGLISQKASITTENKKSEIQRTLQVQQGGGEKLQELRMLEAHFARQAEATGQPLEALEAKVMKVLRSAQGTQQRPGNPYLVEVRLEVGGIVAQARTERLRPQTSDRLRPGMRVRVKLRNVDMRRGQVNVDIMGVPKARGSTNWEHQSTGKLSP